MVHFFLEAKCSVIPRVLSTGPQILYDSWGSALNLGNVPDFWEGQSKN